MSNFYTYFRNYRRLVNGSKPIASPISSDAQTCYTTPKNCEGDSTTNNSIFQMDSSTNKADSVKIVAEEDEGFSHAI